MLILDNTKTISKYFGPKHKYIGTKLNILYCTKLKINIFYSFIFIVCNVRQSALQKFLKSSIKNSKCATSNKHIQDGRPGRYENRRGSKKKAKHAQKKDPTHHPGTRMSEMSSPRRRENQEFGHLTAKRQGFGRKVPNETIVPRR